MTAATFHVRSAESPHGGRDIPGCSEDMKRLARCIRTGEKYQPPGSDNDTSAATNMFPDSAVSGRDAGAPNGRQL